MKGQQALVGGFIGIMVSIIVAVAVTIPVVIDVTNTSNITGTARTILDIVPTLLAAAVIVGVSALFFLRR